jgi:hypothetical protein
MPCDPLRTPERMEVLSVAALRPSPFCPVSPGRLSGVISYLLWVLARGENTGMENLLSRGKTKADVGFKPCIPKPLNFSVKDFPLDLICERHFGVP